MTEAEWLACTEPEKMLEYLRGQASARKLRLFAVACCRRIWHLLGRDSRKAVDVAERYADGLAEREQLERATRRLETRTDYRRWRFGWKHQRAGRAAGAARLAADLAIDSPGRAASYAADVLGVVALEGTRGSHDLSGLVWGEDRWHIRCWRKARGKEEKNHERRRERHATQRSEDAWWCERQAQAGLLRCLCGNPFRPAPVDPGWRTPDVLAMADAIYCQRDFSAERMSVLADALEEVGAAGVLLDHLRGIGLHVRGCWCLDLLMGRD
jgi:hypothetical protein